MTTEINTAELPAATYENYAEIIARVESEVGFSHADWDCVPPEELVRAVLASAPAAPPAPDALRWCASCGEGVTTFCRGSQPCASGLPAPGAGMVEPAK